MRPSPRLPRLRTFWRHPYWIRRQAAIAVVVAGQRQSERPNDVDTDAVNFVQGLLWLARLLDRWSFCLLLTC